VQCAGGSEGGIAQLFGGGDVQYKVVRCESLGDGDEVDGDAGCGVLVVGSRVSTSTDAYPAVVAKCRRAHI
jgi:hypothetical protein